MCNFFGGASGEERSTAAQEGDLAKTLQADFGERFGQQSSTLASLNSTINRIQSGQTGPGYSGAEEAAKTSDIINQTAANARNAQQAVQDRAAGQGGGGTGDIARSSGIRQQVNAEIGAAGANEKSALLARNEENNYNQGRLNATETANLLGRQASLEDPLGFAGAASSANQSTFGMENKINQEDTSGGLFGSLLQAGVGVAKDFVTGGIGNLDSTGGSSTGEQIGNFLKGGLHF